MDIGAILADDKTSHFIFCWQVKSTVQYRDELNDILVTKISKKYYQLLKFGHGDPNITVQLADNILLDSRR